jgi:hypothetical protein
MPYKDRKINLRAALILLLLVAFVCLGCSAGGQTSPKSALQPTLVEQPVISIPLKGPIADRNAEVSGLAWYGEYLIFLPQYPNFSSGYKGDGFLYALPKADIVALLDGRSNSPLEPVAIPLNDSVLRAQIKNYQGFEAIGFSGERVFLTIEAGEGSDMHGYLVAGKVMPGLGGIMLDDDHLVEIPLQRQIDNMSDESLLVLDDRILTIYEVNGVGVNPEPVAHAFDFNLNPLGTVPFPPIEYRISDAALVGDGSRFWVVNCFYPGDKNILPLFDPLTARFGQGLTHSQNETVERLVEMHYSKSGITIADKPPVLLTLIADSNRNWEGLALLKGRGFLLITDKFPETILAFVPMP